VCKSIIPRIIDAERVGYADSKTKIRASQARQFLHSPQENIWLWLRQSLEKAARSGDKISESSILVAMYAKARTYFERKS
jgi:hypothetical protein